MITLNNRYLVIPKSEQKVGIVGDNKVEIRQFEITDSSLFALDFKLDIKDTNDGSGTVDLIKTMENNRIILTFEVLEEYITINGPIYIQLRAFDSAGIKKWHSDIGEMYVGESINSQGNFPPVLLTIEQRVTNIKNEIEVIQADITAKANLVPEMTQQIQDAQDAIDRINEIENDLNQKIEENYFIGPPGYTPQKGIDYFDGEPGAKGDPATFWSGTQLEYDALLIKDVNTLYFVSG